MSGPVEKRFEFLEHVSDAYIAAYGRSMEEAFENAALAMFELMSDTTTVEPKISDQFQLEAHDEYALLYKWLETLLVKFEMDMILYSRFSVTSIKKSNGMVTISAKAEGETYSKEKHQTKVEVKAVTFHRMEIEKSNHVVVRYILDL